MDTIFIGVDPSLVSTGLAYREPDGKLHSYVLRPGDLRGVPRLYSLREGVARLIDKLGADETPIIVVYEGYAMGVRTSNSNNLFGLGELGGVLKLLLYESNVGALVVPPTSLKLYATGSGRADKAAMRDALQKEHGTSWKNSDQNDATWLLLFGESYCSRLHLPRVRSNSYRHRALEGAELLFISQ